ncbi:hypothetical protein DFH08DRAFT_938186 [Mycena albidolilacea]|uniref:Uncharacterized protein n=1 Tax=Mycena albidolilacea TaxID=1033008 RepID=A0AAD6ZWC7_9AGAR|nr:hypothetical protein DFH08DRAFT_938186 [Mycena albidolilacea]
MVPFSGSVQTVPHGKLAISRGAGGINVPPSELNATKRSTYTIPLQNNHRPMSFTTNISSSSRPSFVRSKTMPAFRRALSLPSVDKSLASFRASSSKGIRRMSSFGRSSTSSTSTLKACPSTDSVPVFTTPDYTAPTAPPAAISISPLTRPSFKRAMTMPAPIRALRRIPTLQKVCGVSHKESCASVASTSSVSSVTSSSTTSSASTRRRSSTSTRRRSSVSSIESFSPTEKHMQVTLALRLCAIPSIIIGVLASVLAVIILLLLPALTPKPPKRVLLLRPYEREIVLTEEQERNPPQLPPSSTLSSRFSHGLSKTYQRTIRRAARAQRTTTPQAALSTFFAPTPKRVRAEIPAPVGPKTLTTDIPCVVYYSPVALPLPKGPAPAVLPARRTRRLSVLPTVKEESVEGALCAGW